MGSTALQFIFYTAVLLFTTGTLSYVYINSNLSSYVTEKGRERLLEKETGDSKVSISKHLSAQISPKVGENLKKKKRCIFSV